MEIVAFIYVCVAAVIGLGIPLLDELIDFDVQDFLMNYDITKKTRRD